MENLVLLRKELGLTQTQAAAMFGISMRSYQDYETDKSKVGTIKHNYFINKFKEMLYVDENNPSEPLDKVAVDHRASGSSVTMKFMILIFLGVVLSFVINFSILSALSDTDTEKAELFANSLV